MRRTNMVSGGFLVTLGALSLFEALRIRDDWPGARLMPAVLALVLAVLGVGHFVPSMAGSVTEPSAWPDAAGWRRLAFVFGALVLYVAVLPSLGYLPATALFVLILLRFLRGFSWAMTLVLTAAIAIASHVVFKHWLGMPLPAGPPSRWASASSCGRGRETWLLTLPHPTRYRIGRWARSRWSEGGHHDAIVRDGPRSPDGGRGRRRRRG